MLFLKNQSIISFLSLGWLIKEICLLNSSNVFSTSLLIYSEVKKRHIKILAPNYNTAITPGKAYLRYWEISNKNALSDFSAFFLASPSSYIEPEQMSKLSNLTCSKSERNLVLLKAWVTCLLDCKRPAAGQLCPQ